MGIYRDVLNEVYNLLYLFQKIMNFLILLYNSYYIIMAIIQNKYIADINYYLTNANVKLDNLEDEIDNKINDGTIINLTGLLTRGVGIQGILSGSNLRLNDYNNFMYKNQLVSINFTGGTSHLININSQNIWNNTIYNATSQPARARIAGSNLYTAQYTIVRNSYVGSFTIRIMGQSGTAMTVVKPIYLHLAEDENLKTIVLAEDFVFIDTRIMRIEMLIKKTSSDFGIDNFAGIGLNTYYYNYWEFVGTF